MDIKTKKNSRLRWIKTKIQGKLKLNESDLSQLNYILTDAELIN